MTTLNSLRRAALLLAGTLVVLGVAASVPAAGGRADFTLSASPTSQTVQPGGSTTFTVSMAAVNGFTAPVSLTQAVTGTPSGTSSTTGVAVSVTPATLSSKATTATLSVGTSPSTVTGSYTVTVTGTSGSLTHTVPVTVVVQQPPAAAFSLAVNPTSQTMLPGSAASYLVTITRNSGFTGPVAFVASGFPGGATPNFSPASTTGSTTTLLVATKNTVAPGTYTITVTGSATGSANGQSPVTASAALVITDRGRSFSISGNASAPIGLGDPGQALNLTLTNPNNQPLSVTNLTVSVQSVSRAEGSAGVCGVTDYAVTQVPGAAYPISVPAGGSTTLPASAQPLVRLLDDPTRNQDGCKGATVTLAYTGTGQG